MAANENNPRKTNTVRVLAIIGAVLLLAIAAAIGWLLANSGLPGGGSSSAAWEPTEGVIIETSLPAATDSEVSTEPVMSFPAETSAADREANRLSEVPVPTPQSGAIPAAAQADGVNERGWASNGTVNCASGEQLIYAARGSDAWVTVCESGSGAMTYRSDIFGGTLTAPVMPGASSPASGRFMVDASPAVISVQGAGLIVEQDGQVISRAALPVAWVFS